MPFGRRSSRFWLVEYTDGRDDRIFYYHGAMLRHRAGARIIYVGRLNAAGRHVITGTY